MRGGPLYSLHRSYLNSFVIERTAVARSRSLGGCTQVSEEPHSSLLLSKISVIPSICMLHGENSGNATTELTLNKRDITGDRVLNILIISPERIMPVRCTSLTSDGSFPPSPTDDTTSKRLSWGKLVQKLTEFSGASFNHSVDSDSDSCSRSDCSDSGSDFLSDVSTSDSDMFYDPMEETLCEEVVELISSSLSDAKDGPLKCSKLLIPHQLLEHIGQELRHLAASEPCGLRGALIDLCVEQEDICRSVEQIAVDPYLVPTFQLTLVLRLESEGLWPKIQGLFAARAHSTPTVKHALKLSTGFRVIKKKLYSSEELLIEEC